MMKFLIALVFLVPLSLIKNSFWLNQYLYFILTFFFCFLFSVGYQVSYISYFFGCDLLSFMMVLLSFWVCSLMILASQKIYIFEYYYNMFLFIMISLLISLVLTFSSMNMFMFYLFFEVSLIPTLILIVGWGYQPERLQAGVYLLFYTLLVSLPMMISIFYYYNVVSSLDFCFAYFLNGSFFMYVCMCSVFLVKMPMYFVHLWLPKAHVEAPVAGSMILAGIMLKLGGYGLMRFMIIFLEVGMSVNFVFIIISMVGGVFVSLICLRQVDIKSLIAYSSVSHMGLVLSGIMTLNYWGLTASLVMMIAHGLCSSGLFCLANIVYERTSSRTFFLNKGLINLMPSMALWWFLFCCCNMSAPPSLNLLGEIMLINSLIGWSNWIMLMIMFLSFFGAAYSLYLYSYVQHGKIYMGLYSFSGGSVREYLLLFLHWAPLNFLIMKSEFLVLWL
nr:NADH dehydrogenase subunit 4 [Megasoma elephas elephas]UFR82963.1 NADH dehydrogenase subunit 4 [Megasoma mars]